MQQLEQQRQAALSAAQAARTAQAATTTNPSLGIPAPSMPAMVYQLNYAIPAYLSTPEPRAPGESLWAVLAREIIRSILKALGHALAHFFDARSIRLAT